jgi:hypothetical protein
MTSGAGAPRRCAGAGAATRACSVCTAAAAAGAAAARRGGGVQLRCQLLLVHLRRACARHVTQQPSASGRMTKASESARRDTRRAFCCVALGGLGAGARCSFSHAALRARTHAAAVRQRTPHTMSALPTPHAPRRGGRVRAAAVRLRLRVLQAEALLAVPTRGANERRGGVARAAAPCLFQPQRAQRGRHLRRARAGRRRRGRAWRQRTHATTQRRVIQASYQPRAQRRAGLGFCVSSSRTQLCVIRQAVSAARCVTV